jgi:hypothetical protein
MTILAVLTALFAVLLTVVPAKSAVTSCPSPTGVPALQHMHSHNDYEDYADGKSKSQPLCTGLSYGATSAEADVYYDGPSGQLILKHGPSDPVRGNLIDQYLAPLWQLYNARPAGQKWLYPSWPRPFTLVVEIKDTAPANDTAIGALQVELASYLPMLTAVSNGKVTEGMVTVLLTGQANTSSVRTDPVQDTFVNLTDNTFLRDDLLDGLPPLSVAPLVNVDWCDIEYYLMTNADPVDRNSAQWCDYTNMTEGDGWHLLDGNIQLNSESALENFLATSAHQAGLKIRLWHVPDESSDGSIVRPSYFATELGNELDYVSANSTDDASATVDFDAVSDAVYAAGDGCDGGAGQCVLGARATVSVTRGANGNPVVTGTVWSTSANWCGDLELLFYNANHEIVHNIWVTAVCGTTPRPFGVTVNGAGPYAAVGTQLSSTEPGSLAFYDFYYL